MTLLIHTDFGHDPDDAIAISYLIEHGVVPNIIGVSPGHIQQVESLFGLCDSYSIMPEIYSAKDQPLVDTFHTGKHRIFDNQASESAFSFAIGDMIVDTALVIGPAINLGGRLTCTEMFFQGGYSPNSVKPLEKFKGKYCVPSFNPNGSRKDFRKLLETDTIQRRRYIGKNVCHGFTKEDLSKIWVPENKKVRKFWDSLSPSKAMHDVLAAMMMLNEDLGIWEDKEPMFAGSGMTTVPTTRDIKTLIGVNINATRRI